MLCWQCIAQVVLACFCLNSSGNSAEQKALTAQLSTGRHIRSVTDLQAAAALRQVRVAVDPAQAVHVYRKPAHVGVSQ